jgi:hypothetical protein
MRTDYVLALVHVTIVWSDLYKVNRNYLLLRLLWRG